MLGEVFSDEDCDAADEAPELLAAFLRAAMEALTSRINAVKSYSQSCTYMLCGKDTSLHSAVIRQHIDKPDLGEGSTSLTFSDRRIGAHDSTGRLGHALHQHLDLALHDGRHGIPLFEESVTLALHACIGREGHDCIGRVATKQCWLLPPEGIRCPSRNQSSSPCCIRSPTRYFETSAYYSTR